MKKKLGALFLAFCMCIAGLLSPMSVLADEPTAKTVLKIKIGGKTYENVENGSVIVGDFDLKDLDFWVLSVNGNKLENVGSKSGVQDRMGRNPLEVATINSGNRCTVTLTYHAGDDPVAANQAYEFAVAGIIFTNSADNASSAPTVSAVKSVKATALSKA